MMLPLWLLLVMSTDDADAAADVVVFVVCGGVCDVDGAGGVGCMWFVCVWLFVCVIAWTAACMTGCMCVFVCLCVCVCVRVFVCSVVCWCCHCR